MARWMRETCGRRASSAGRRVPRRMWGMVRQKALLVSSPVGVAPVEVASAMLRRWILSVRHMPAKAGSVTVADEAVPVSAVREEDAADCGDAPRAPREGKLAAL